MFTKNAEATILRETSKIKKEAEFHIAEVTEKSNKQIELLRAQVFDLKEQIELLSRKDEGTGQVGWGLSVQMPWLPPGSGIWNT